MFRGSIVILLSFCGVSFYSFLIFIFIVLELDRVSIIPRV